MAHRTCGLMLVLVLVAACSTATEGADSTVATTTPAATTTISPTTTAAATTTAVSEDSDVVPITTPPCDLLTADDVEAATGFTVTDVQDDPPMNCLFELDVDPRVYVVMTVEDGAGRFAGPANLFTEYGLLIDDGEAAEIGGIGEGALCCPFRAIAVDAGGGRYIAISVGGGYNALDEPFDALTTLAEIALERL